jgi:prepilin-type N-terminal cleavage/methylation domain-containing protein
MPPATTDHRIQSQSESVAPRSSAQDETSFFVTPGWGSENGGGRGYSLVELLVVILVAAIIIAMAIPQVLSALKGYRLHGDASAIAAQLNVTRFRATSQFTPYRMNIFTATSPQSFTMERLCGTDTDCLAPVAPCVQSYMPYLQADIESGSQYLSTGDTFTTTNPGGAVLPPSLGGTGTGSTVFYFNTRGLPVDCKGTPLSDGGAVIYLKNGNNLSDAVVVTVGGRISIYAWSPGSNSWVIR